METNQTITNTGEVQDQTQNEFFNEEFYTKMDGMLAKRFDGLTKSILKDNGMEDDGIKDFISKYKVRNDNKQKAIETELNALRTENENLKNKIFDGVLKNSVTGLAEKIGFDDKYTSQIIKLADLTDVKNKDGLNQEKLEEAIKKVVEDCEAFKKVSKPKEESTSGFQTIGGSNSTDKPEDLIDKIRKAAMGF